MDAIPPKSHLNLQEIFYVSTPHADAQLAAVDNVDTAAAGAYDTPLGITNPPIDELLDRASSKYALVIYAAKRARQINDYYNQLGDGILEYVGPLVEPGLQEKPLSIALPGNPVHTGVWDDVHEVPHVRIGQEADLVVVAPATADLLARAVAGRADDLLTATLLTARCPVLFAPAMHTEMWLHPATVDNVATLRRRGAVVLEPASGRLTGTDSGTGRLPEAEEITTLAHLLLERHDALPYDLAGRKLLVTAGGTREPIDPVRFIGNRSSGRMGIALAAAARRRGAEVTLIAAN